jgi:hypothetical protein
VNDVRASVAKREAREYMSERNAGVYIFLAIEAVILGVMAFFQIPLAWLITVGFLVSTFIICQAVVDGIGRLDAGRGYLEQVCHDMNERLVKMHWQMS